MSRPLSPETRFRRAVKAARDIGIEPKAITVGDITWHLAEPAKPPQDEPFKVIRFVKAPRRAASRERV